MSCYNSAFPPLPGDCLVRLLTRYVLRQIWVPALLAALVISVVIVAGGIQKQVTVLLEELPIAQLNAFDISRISLFALPELAGFILPITFLLGIMLTFARMAQQNEVTAMKAAGVSLKRIVVPVIIAGAVLSGVSFLIQDQGQPWAYRQFSQWRTNLLLRMTFDMLPTGVMHEYGGWRVYIGSKSDDGALHDIVVQQPQEDGRSATYYAESARIEKSGSARALVLREGHGVQPMEDGSPMRSSFGEFTLSLPELAAGATADTNTGQTLQGLYVRQLETEANYRAEPNDRDALNLIAQRMEIGGRLAFPLMCLAVSIVAAPIGIRARRAGRSYSFIAGVVIVASYFILRKLAESLIVPIPALGVMIAITQIPNIVLCVAGLVLLRRVDRV